MACRSDWGKLLVARTADARFGRVASPVGVAFAAALPLLLVGAAVVVRTPLDGLPALLVALAFPTGGVALIWFALTRRRFEFYEGGAVYLLGGVRATEIAVADLATVTYRTGFRDRDRLLRLEATADVAAARIDYRRYRAGDADCRTMSGLAVHYARPIAARMAEEITAGREIVWTPTLRLGPAGIRHIGFPGGAGEIRIPWEDLVGFVVDGGGYSIRSRFAGLPAIEGSTGERNFIPGELIVRARV